MGNKITHHPRVLLTDGVALNIKSSNLARDVLPIIEEWRKEGSDLALNLEEFERTFSVVKDVQQQFDAFDTDRNGIIDTHEVLMVYVLLCNGDVGDKVDAVFSIFDFPGTSKQPGTINFDEAVLLFHACVGGLQKVCELLFAIPEDELVLHCKSMFDMHRLSRHDRIARKQFKEWTFADSAPSNFVALVHNAHGLPDIYTAVQRRNADQGVVFQILANGAFFVTPDELLNSADFRRVIGTASDDEVETLVHLMSSRSGHPNQIDHDQYHTVLRPWNVFNECDLDGSGCLDDKEMEILLWIQMRAKPSPELVRDFLSALDENQDGLLSREEWVKAAAVQGDGFQADRAGPNAASHESGSSAGELDLTDAQRRRLFISQMVQAM
eukprot:TRINITY_DN51455_c0_g1_i1.p1 TRINITY_DN51455_c0_g1~~TRINITY_DN51455_c0_g1_i1.p1  ORF type:complete len:382 (-),score=74.30 TRINITY_DN51455_c0_g1_i1:136-1281(-)